MIRLLLERQDENTEGMRWDVTRNGPKPPNNQILGKSIKSEMYFVGGRTPREGGHKQTTTKVQSALVSLATVVTSLWSATPHFADNAITILPI